MKTTKQADITEACVLPPNMERGGATCYLLRPEHLSKATRARKAEPPRPKDLHRVLVEGVAVPHDGADGAGLKDAPGTEEFPSAETRQLP